MANPWRLLPHIRGFMRWETQPPLPYSSLKVQLWDGCLLFVLGTLRSASGHHSDSCLSPPPARGTSRGPLLWQKATFHQKSETVNQDAFMLFMMRYPWWQEGRLAGLLGPFQTSAPAGHDTHLLQTSFPLLMLTHTPKQIINENMYQQIILNV